MERGEEIHPHLSYTIIKCVGELVEIIVFIKIMYQFAVVFLAPVKVGKAVEFSKRLHEL